MELYKMYKSSGDIKKAEYWKTKAISIASKANDERLLKEIKTK